MTNSWIFLAGGRRRRDYRLDERIDFSRVGSSITRATRSGVRAIRLAADSLISPHQFEKAERVADGMDFADLIGVNSRDWD